MHKLSIILLIGIFTLSSCSLGSKEYKPQEYISTTGNAAPGTETKIELEDGAAIVIPGNAIDSDVSVKVERNPEKSNNLPPLDENLVAVGDFYNFEIDGTINGAVDLILPFDPELVPENEAGVLVVAIPKENGWKYIPVVPNGNKVTLYTDEVGDPLIAWHFSNSDEWDKQVEEKLAQVKFCNPTIALNVTPESGESNQSFTLTGRVIPLEGAFTTIMGDKLASLILRQETSSFRDLPVEIVINNNPKKTISTRTNQDGSFEVTINPEQDSSLGYKEQMNWLKASAQCSSIFDPNSTSEAVGYSSFNLSPKQQVQSVVTQITESPIATLIPVQTEQPIPTGAVLLPDFIGQNIDDAINWLESNGFKYTWVDGSSTYDLGAVFRQVPMGGQYKIPHRTVVVLYRTTERANSNLTPDLYAKYRCVKRLADVKHTCDFSKGLYIKGIWDSCSESDNIEIELTSANSAGAPTFSNDWFIYWAPLNGENLFRSSTSTSEVDDWKTHIRKTSALELVPVQIESITIMGKTIDVQRYEGSNTNEYECHYNERGEAQGYTQTNKYINYYDISTGLLVKWETFSKVTDCFFCDSNFVGATSNSIWEIFDTNQIIGK